MSFITFCRYKIGNFSSTAHKILILAPYSQIFLKNFFYLSLQDFCKFEGYTTSDLMTKSYGLANQRLTLSYLHMFVNIERD